MAALVRYLSDGQFTQLGLNGHWRPAPCAAAVMRIGVVRYYSTEKSDPQSANDRLPKTATHTIDPK